MTRTNSKARMDGVKSPALLREVINAGTSPRQARLPMTPEEVAASYAEADEGLADRGFGSGPESREDLPADDEPGDPDGPAGGGPEFGGADFGDPGYGDCAHADDGEAGMDPGSPG